MSESVNLDDLYGSYEAADYLGMDLGLFRWRVDSGVGPKPDRVLSKVLIGDLFTRRTLDEWKATADILEVEWPQYVCMEKAQFRDWGRLGQYRAYAVWAPQQAMTAASESDAARNAVAWQFVADNWGELTCA